MLDVSTRLVIRCGDGQFSFRHFDSIADDEQLYEIATELNSFQECNLEKILRIHVMEF